MKKAAKNVLGRGLSSLISTPPVSLTQKHFDKASDAGAIGVDNSANAAAREVRDSSKNLKETASGVGVRFVEIASITNNETQPRQEFDDKELAELAESIRSLGVLQPVLVRPSKGDSRSSYEIVAGERRWRAGKIAGLSQIPVIIKDLDDKETLEIALVENIQRSALNPIEEAKAYERLSTEFSMSQKELSERVGKDRASISNYLRVLKLPSFVLDMIQSGKLSMGHAKAILSVREPSAQISLAKKVNNEGLSVRALEAIVSRVVVLDTARNATNREERGDSSSRRAKGGAFPEITDKMRRRLGTKVSILHHASGRGRIEVDYFSEQELDRIVELICSNQNQ